MADYKGDFAPGATVRDLWNSSDSNGASVTRSTNGTISVYKDGGTTQSTAGVTDTEDFDSLTGVHLVEIDTSADGTFYSAGSDFIVVLSAATIDTRTVNAALFSFSLNNRTALRSTIAGRTLDVSAGGEAGVDWANVGSPTTTVGLSGTTVKTATDVEADTADIQTRLGTAGAGLTAVPWNAAWDAEVQSECTDAFNAYDPPTNAEMEARTIAAATYATASALDTVDNFLDTEIAAIKVKTDLIPGTIDGKTFSELVTLIAAVLLGKASGLATTTAVYRAIDDSKARVTATVDGDGNRSAVTLDAS